MKPLFPQCRECPEYDEKHLEHLDQRCDIARPVVTIMPFQSLEYGYSYKVYVKVLRGLFRVYATNNGYPSIDVQSGLISDDIGAGEGTEEYGVLFGTFDAQENSNTYTRKKILCFEAISFPNGWYNCGRCYSYEITTYGSDFNLKDDYPNPWLNFPKPEDDPSCPC